MKDLLWFALNGERLIVLTKRAVHVFDCQNWNCVFKVNASFIGLSKDETLIATINRDNDISVWNIATGKPTVTSPEMATLFADHQRIRLQSKGASIRTFADIFTGAPTLQLHAPQLSESEKYFGVFDRHFFRFPGQPYIFQSTFLDTGWGESIHLWCYDIVKAEWLFDHFYSVNGTPRAFLSPYTAFCVAVWGNKIYGYDLEQKARKFEYDVFYAGYSPKQMIQEFGSSLKSITAIAFYPADPLKLLIADQNEITQFDISNQMEIKIADQSDVVSLSLHPQSDLFCTLINSDQFFNGKLSVLTLDGSLLEEIVLIGFV